MTKVAPPFDVEAGFRYVTRLRGPASQMNAPDWSVDWDDAPWPFKVYEGGPRVPMRTTHFAPQVDETHALARVLHLAVGCLRARVLPGAVVHDAPERGASPRRGTKLFVRRAIASGGALYPAEVYVCPEGIHAAGVHHYDAARHELVTLPAERPRARLASALGLSPTAGRTYFLVTNNFWKNFCKYGDFGYRLGAVDLGIALARLHRLSQLELGDATVQFDFDDRAINDILGLDGREESIYAAVVVERRRTTSERAHPPAPTSALFEQPRAMQKSVRIKRSADFDAMHASCLRTSSAGSSTTASTTAASSTTRVVTTPSGPALGCVELPEAVASGDVFAAILARSSNGPLFTGKPTRTELLATVLTRAHEALHVLRTADEAPLPKPSLWVVVQHVVGVPPGAYRYEPATGSLALVRPGDHGLRLQACSNLNNINLDLAAFVLHVVDHLDLRASSRGNRAYRVQQMLVGATLDAAMLACAGLGLGCHPMLGFDAAGIDALYGLVHTGTGALAQLCVGVARPGLHLEGNLNMRPG